MQTFFQKTSFFFLILAFFLIPWDLKASDYCRQSSSDARHDSLLLLESLDDLYLKTAWYYRRHQELYYGPLWTANLRRNDSFSSQTRGEGNISFERYLSESRVQKSLAQDSGGRLMSGLKALEKFKNTGCDAQEMALRKSNSGEVETGLFSICMADFEDQVMMRIKALRKYVRRHLDRQEIFSKQVQKTLRDKPSEHDPFENRFRDTMELLYLQGNSQFIALTREIRDLFETEWPIDTCCNVCKDDIKLDPVLREVKPDLQASGGVDGRVVNNANLKKAFEDWEKEENPNT